MFKNRILIDRTSIKGYAKNKNIRVNKTKQKKSDKT